MNKQMEDQIFRSNGHLGGAMRLLRGEESVFPLVHALRRGGV